MCGWCGRAFNQHLSGLSVSKFEKVVSILTRGKWSESTPPPPPIILPYSYLSSCFFIPLMSPFSLFPINLHHLFFLLIPFSSTSVYFPSFSYHLSPSALCPPFLLFSPFRLLSRPFPIFPFPFAPSFFFLFFLDNSFSIFLSLYSSFFFYRLSLCFFHHIFFHILSIFLSLCSSFSK